MSVPLPLAQLFDRFPNDAAAERWFVRERGPDGVRCPSCHSNDVQARATRRPQPYRCRHCRRDFPVKTDTVMHGSHLGLRIWTMAIHLLTSRPKGVSSRQLHRDLGISCKAAWHLSHRIREAYGTDPELCQGPAEVDETYVGGFEKNKHADRARCRRQDPDGRSQGPAVPRSPCGGGARLYTDEAAAYRGLDEYRHASINHGDGE